MSSIKNNPYNKLFHEQNNLALFKAVIAEQGEQLKQAFQPRKSVKKLLHNRSDFIDEILCSCWQHFLAEYSHQLCLLAVGGYGRRELFPHSDIDIVVLLDDNDKDQYQEPLSNFFNFLWDIGLKPGQSVRTIPESIEAAKADQTIMTCILENRKIVGNNNLYQNLKKLIRSEKVWPSDQFFAAKMAEQQQRYAKFHDTAYNLEPNVKEGPGGLRDMQVIAWVFKHHYNSSTVKELIKYGFLPESEYSELISARDVIWRIRYALHILTGRCEDRLVFDYQRDLAKQFGFHGSAPNQDVEQFMRHYFKIVVGLERLNEMLLQLFNEHFIDNTSQHKQLPNNSNFKVINGYLEAISKDIFKEAPLALLEVFLLLQQNTSLKGIRATTIRLIRKNLKLIDDDFRNNKDANRLFMEILRQPQGITHELRRMNRYGVLSAYLPSFANIVGRMQYDLFHIYTVDEHTMFVIRNLRKFSLEKHINELPFCNDIFLLIPKPDLLYIAALFHDIAKGKEGDHSIIGEQIAEQFCQQHELSKHDTKLITWLVRNHLIMSMTAQRKDISDPDIIHEFALQVGNIEYLNYLYLLTVADIRATNPELWNSWKDALLKELYNATHSALHRGLQNPVTIIDRINENKNEAKEHLIKLGLSEPSIIKSWEHASDDYFLRYSADEIAWHTAAISSSNEGELPLVLLRPQTQRGSAEVFVYTRNKKNIFSLSTETLDQLGLTILDARIVTTSDQYVLNSFQVLEQSGEAIKDLYREVHICNSLRKNLLSRSVKQTSNISRLSRQAKHFPIPTTILFHEDPQQRFTIMELITTDHAGLLSTIGKVFIQHKTQLHDAKITTIGSRAEDMFHITDEQMRPIDNNTKQLIKQQLLDALDNPKN